METGRAVSAGRRVDSTFAHHVAGPPWEMAGQHIFTHDLQAEQILWQMDVDGPTRPNRVFPSQTSFASASLRLVHQHSLAAAMRSVRCHGKHPLVATDAAFLVALIRTKNFWCFRISDFNSYRIVVELRPAFGRQLQLSFFSRPCLLCPKR